MPNTFWKYQSEEDGIRADLETLKEKYIEDGRKAAGHIMEDREVLAVWLSGPFDHARVQPASDLHMTVLLGEGKGIFYHHQLPPFSRVGRRLEIAFFPIDYFQRVLEKGYSRLSVLFDLHKLKEVIILFEKNGVLSRLAKQSEEAKPARLFVGGQIEALRSEFIRMERLASESRYGECVMSAREIMTRSLLLLLSIGRGFIFSKSSHLYPELRSNLPSALAERFELVEAISGLDKAEARRRIEKTRKLARFLFEKHRACGDGSG